MLEQIFGHVNILEKGLDAVWKKNEIIANNIANSDTPDFKASHLEFESVFKEALKTDSDSFFSSKSENQANVENSTSSSLSADDTLMGNITQDGDIGQTDGNSVDIDSEMSELAQNSVLYNTLSYSISKEFARLKTLIGDGR